MGTCGEYNGGYEVCTMGIHGAYNRDNRCVQWGHKVCTMRKQGEYNGDMWCVQ